MICEEVGVAVAPLLGGAAVVGLAVAFGAQNLIRDYFYGFVILLENQYKINDVLKIGDVSGQVERITLRMTVLRDLEGSVHFIPNGKIDCVTNMTHGWSRALFEIKVSFNEDTDHVVDMLMDIAKGLRAEPQYGRVILEDPEMLGVDALGDTWATIKFVIKTRPLKQWLVKREMLRRIRKKFSENGIGMPIQQRVIHHRGEHLAQNLPSSVIDAETPRAA
jgi:small conductance mechanosensitive channel